VSSFVCCARTIAQIPLLSRHDTTRRATRYLAMILAQEKVVTCCVALVGQHGATRSSRQARQARLARHVSRGAATAWTGWTGHVYPTFSEVVVEIDANPEHRSKREHYTASSSSVMLEQERRDTHDKRDTLVATHGTRMTLVTTRTTIGPVRYGHFLALVHQRSFLNDSHFSICSTHF